jgi:formiminotetrahydrofolate cyclodeaminase
MSDPVRLLDHSVADFARRLASGDPTPGGGSASALSAALGASLVSMVANLTAGRPAARGHEATLQEITQRAASASGERLELVELDAAAYDAVVAARRVIRAGAANGDDDRAHAPTAHGATLHAAIIEATRVPLRIAACAADVLRLAERLAAIGNRHALSDVAVAGDLAWAGLRGGLANVRANLPSLGVADPIHAEIAPQLAELDRLATRGLEPIRAALAEREHA